MMIKIMQGRMRLLHLVDKLLLESMFLVPFMIDSKRLVSFYSFSISISIFIILLIILGLKG